MADGVQGSTVITTPTSAGSSSLGLTVTPESFFLPPVVSVCGGRRKSRSALPGNCRWKRGAKIGEGGQGVVYSGFDLLSGRLVAIKEMKCSLGDEQSVLQEIQLLEVLSHENIVKLFDFFLTSSSRRLNLILEKVDGGSLSALLRHLGRLPAKLVKNYGAQCLSGLSYLHESGVMHLDLKPANLLVSSLGVVKIVDFGTASILATTQLGLTRSPNRSPQAPQTPRAFIGTLGYMAPETARGDPSLASDIWSFGMTVFELMEGKLPWDMKGGVEHAAFALRLGSMWSANDLPRGFGVVSVSANCTETVSRCLVPAEGERLSADELLLSDFFRGESEFYSRDESQFYNTHSEGSTQPDSQDTPARGRPRGLFFVAHHHESDKRSLLPLTRTETTDSINLRRQSAGAITKYLAGSPETLSPEDPMKIDAPESRFGQLTEDVLDSLAKEVGTPHLPMLRSKGSGISSHKNGSGFQFASPFFSEHLTSPGFRRGLSDRVGGSEHGVVGLWGETSSSGNPDVKFKFDLFFDSQTTWVALYASLWTPFLDILTAGSGGVHTLTHIQMPACGDAQVFLTRCIPAFAKDLFQTPAVSQISLRACQAKFFSRGMYDLIAKKVVYSREALSSCTVTSDEQFCTAINLSQLAFSGAHCPLQLEVTFCNTTFIITLTYGHYWLCFTDGLVKSLSHTLFSHPHPLYCHLLRYIWSGTGLQHIIQSFSIQDPSAEADSLYVLDALSTLRRAYQSQSTYSGEE